MSENDSSSESIGLGNKGNKNDKPNKSDSSIDKEKIKTWRDGGLECWGTGIQFSKLQHSITLRLYDYS